MDFPSAGGGDAVMLMHASCCQNQNATAKREAKRESHFPSTDRVENVGDKQLLLAVLCVARSPPVAILAVLI